MYSGLVTLAGARVCEFLALFFLGLGRLLRPSPVCAQPEQPASRAKQRKTPTTRKRLAQALHHWCLPPCFIYSLLLGSNLFWFGGLCLAPFDIPFFTPIRLHTSLYTALSPTFRYLYVLHSAQHPDRYAPRPRCRAFYERGLGPIIMHDRRYNPRIQDRHTEDSNSPHFT